MGEILQLGFSRLARARGPCRTSVRSPKEAIAPSRSLDAGMVAELEEEKEQSLERLRRWHSTIKTLDPFCAPSAAEADQQLKHGAERALPPSMSPDEIPI